MSQHEDVGSCTECKSDQPDSHTIRQLEMGFDNFPCKYCGGVAIVVNKATRSHSLDKVDERRGLS